MRNMQTTTNVWLPELINGLFDTEILPRTGWMPRIKTTTPAINVIESDKEYLLEVAAPGMRKQDFSIKIDENDNLVVKIERATANETKDAEGQNAEHTAEADSNAARSPRYIRREFAYGKYEQAFTMPEDVERKDIKAKVENGILTITLPKVVVEEEPKVSTQIAID